MDLRETPEQSAFRAEARAWLEANVPSEPLESFDTEIGFAQHRDWERRLSEGRWSAVSWPEKYGGRGADYIHWLIFEEEYYRSGAPGRVNQNGIFLLGPTIMEVGTDFQKDRFLPTMASSEIVWAQAWSEPNAGSDLAGIRSKATRDGDEWILNGQKVWTTLAHVSDYGIVIARTDPDQPKHAGISMFIIDLKAPGVEIRPIHQIDGGRHFNEVFLTDVRVPTSDLLGEMNNGWRQATAMLMYERVAIGSIGAGKVAQPMYDMLVKWARQSGAINDAVVRDELMQMYIMESTKSMVAMRSRAEMKAGKAPGPGGSLGKLYSSIIARRFREIAQNIAGPASVAWEGEDSAEELLSSTMLNSLQSGIAGGTDEIQRNIIGDRVLGLPRDISVDRDVAFKDLKVGTQR